VSALQGAAVAWGQRHLLARAAAAALAALLAFLLLVAAVFGVLAAQQSPSNGPISGYGLPAAALPFLEMYEDAARVYRVNPFLLMAVHEDESSFGTSTLPGVRSGTNGVCCAGPMQFSVTGTAFGGSGGTWAGYRNAHRAAKLARPASYPNQYGPHPNVYDSYDAIYAAALYFHALGAGPALDDRTYQALISYKGNPPASIPYARHDYDRAQELQALSRPGGGGYGGAGQLAWPTPTRAIISPFGMRWGRLHAGIDIPVPNGTRLAAAAVGRVTLTCANVSPCSGYGNFTCIQHAAQLSSCYAHQSAILVRTGAVVRRGQVIGLSGCTGHCLGPHLHFEVRLGRYPATPVDPVPYLR